MKHRCVIQISDKKVMTPVELPDGKYYADVLTTDTRSTPQNRYYFGLVVPLVQKALNDLGTDVGKQEVHEYLKAKFNYKELVNHDTGEYERIPVSTSRLNKGEFKEYIEKIQVWAADFLHLEIPDPGVQTELTFSSLKK